MTPQGSILLADDEDTFLEATKDLLEEEGYSCHGVHDASELSAALASSEYDLLITDLNMPGNRIMEKVSQLREQAKIMPVIVVTGYPSVPTAVESVRLNVLEYMIKPVNFPALLDAVKRGIHHKQTLGTITHARQDAENRTQALSALEETLRTFRLPEKPQATLTQFTSLPRHSSQEQPGSDASAVPSMTDYFRLRESVFHTIQVLQKTKSAFRSKDLAGLRKYLETVLCETTDTLKNPRDSTDTPSGTE
ncbi:MAG: response regulator [Nitrospirota bacterium]|nr:response regulator [Nitrospirota bacterium]MDH5586325.1 response regulator [Nitrospirota bacterium]MDH5773355.1 response regulator [Nitrospirota bacterium]